MSEILIENMEKNAIQKIEIIRLEENPIEVIKEKKEEKNVDRDVCVHMPLDAEVMDYEKGYDSTLDKTFVAKSSYDAVNRDSGVVRGFEVPLTKEEDVILQADKISMLTIYKMAIDEINIGRLFRGDRFIRISMPKDYSVIFNNYDLVERILFNLNCYEAYPLMILNKVCYRVVYYGMLTHRFTRKTVFTDFLSDKIDNMKHKDNVIDFNLTCDQYIGSINFLHTKERLVNMFLRGVGNFPSYLMSLNFRTRNHDMSLIYYFVCFLDYIKFRSGTAKYYNYLEEMCVFMRPYWKYLYYVLRTYDRKYERYYSFVETEDNFTYTYVYDFPLEVYYKEVILKKYHMEFLLQADMVIYDRPKYVNEDEFFDHDDICLYCAANVRYVRERDFRSVGPFSFGQISLTLL
jgi:hypothetical protein